MRLLRQCNFIVVRQKFGSYVSFIHFYRFFSDINYRNNNTILPSYFSGADEATIKVVDEHFKLYENFVSENEEIEFMKEIDPIIKRRRYERDHWDGAIQSYKETEKADWNSANNIVLKRLRTLAFPENCSQIKHVHVLDLSKEGYIKPHIDSVKFCGDTIAGISLLSTSVMRLAMENQKDIFVDILLPRRSLYVMKGVARYNYTHEILEEPQSYFKGQKIPRNRRVSVICRNEPIDVGS